MSLLLYISISTLGLLLTHVLSEFYVVKQRLGLILIYLSVFVVFSVQHYTILFDKMFFDEWLFFISTSDKSASDLFRFLSAIFLALEVLTVPKSKLGIIYHKLFLVFKIKK